MKTNKKAILGFAIAMIFSLSILQSMSSRANNSDRGIQQVSIGAGYMAGRTEGRRQFGWGVISAISGTVASNVAYGALVNSWNPGGWIGWGVAGGLAL